ncbi:hypothetical protein [Spirosoma arcticum]
MLRPNPYVWSVNVFRIGPAQLATDYKDLIEHLAVRWTVADLPAPIPYLYLDYVQAIGTLLLTTQSGERTRLIFTVVLNQAIALNRPSWWVEWELKFEGMIDGVDRADFLRLDLEQRGGDMDDETLDTYNERLYRFTNDDP